MHTHVTCHLNQDYWLSDAAVFAPEYARTIDRQVAWIAAAGMRTIINLQWSDGGDLKNKRPHQYPMADQNSLRMWRQVACRYSNRGDVLFELFNESFLNATNAGGEPWSVWRDGSAEWVGYQALYDAVRSVGANNLVIVGGLNWAFDLSKVMAHRIREYKAVSQPATSVLYNTHPYDYVGKRPHDWHSAFGYLAGKVPLIATEFGT
jgi:hypothetical protein